MKNKHPFLRFLLFAAEILLLWLLQATPGLMPALFGTKPFLLLAGALAIASCEEAAPSVIFGAVCGVLADLSAGGTVGFFAVAFTLVCFAQASLLGTYLNHNLPTAAVVSLGSSAAVLSLYFLLFRAFAGAPDSAALYFFGYLPRVLYTAMTFVPLYGLNRLITKRL